MPHIQLNNSLIRWFFLILSFFNFFLLFSHYQHNPSFSIIDLTIFEKLIVYFFIFFPIYFIPYFLDSFSFSFDENIFKPQYIIQILLAIISSLFFVYIKKPLFILLNSLIFIDGLLYCIYKLKKNYHSKI